MEYDSFDAVLHFIFRSVRDLCLFSCFPTDELRQTQGDAWFKPSEENVSAGVCLRVEPGQFRVFPYGNPFLGPFEAAVRGLNPLVATKVRSAAAHSALSTVYVVICLQTCVAVPMMLCLSVRRMLPPFISTLIPVFKSSTL